MVGSVDPPSRGVWYLIHYALFGTIGFIFPFLFSGLFFGILNGVLVGGILGSYLAVRGEYVTMNINNKDEFEKFLESKQYVKKTVDDNIFFDRKKIFFPYFSRIYISNDSLKFKVTAPKFIIKDIKNVPL